MATDGLPLAAAFELRSGEEHLSVNWLEYLNASDLGTAVDQVRGVFQARGYRLRPNERFATLNVGATKKALAEAGAAMARVEHLPVEDDESHSGVFGYSEDDFAVAVELRALVHRNEVYPATTDSA